jgi:hypothetical protein
MSFRGKLIANICDGTAEFVCGYQAPTGESNGNEEYYNVMLATPQRICARYGRLEDGLWVAIDTESVRPDYFALSGMYGGIKWLFKK